MSSLVMFVSTASALQRQDRAGHVRNGFCFRLYPKSRFLAFMDFAIPEILRQCEYVSNAVFLFQGIGACSSLSPLGCHPAHEWQDAHLRHHLGLPGTNCKLRPSTPFSRRFYPNNCLANRWKIIPETTYCRKHFLNRTALITIKYIKQELIRMMDQVVFSSSSESGQGPASRDRSDPTRPQAPLTPLGKAQICVLNAVVTGGLCDSVGRILYTPSVDALDRVACSVETSQGKAHVHPSSFNHYLLFQEKVRDIDVQNRERLISLVEWIHFQVRTLLEKMTENPRMNLESYILPFLCLSPSFLSCILFSFSNFKCCIFLCVCVCVFMK
uniref:Uncharacterized protein n=1 Tax=Salmo trutta TaxID=8032 RepID=A0A673YE85_SALTR